jgi:ribose transport system substrate-binding protein
MQIVLLINNDTVVSGSCHSIFVSVKYSMLMDENFFINNKSNSGLKEYKKNFLIVMYHTSDNFLGRFQSAILEEAEKRQIRIDYVNVESITEAIDSINTAVAAKMDGIIAQGFYNEDYIEAINNAIEKGLAVQFVYTDARGTDRSYFVGYNAYDFGKKAARCAIEELPGLRGILRYWYKVLLTMKRM